RGAGAATPDVGGVVRERRTALEPARPSIRKLTLSVSRESGDPSQVTVGQVRGTAGLHRRILNVVLAPESLRGIAYLVQEGGAGDDVQWLYVPALGRVRQVMSREDVAAFLYSHAP